ncbi:carbamoyltransferase C-terminal domain-containing protein [Dankookia sp. P2]|uniref:carbamoyltransferase C-terminal domain-containing protein n=1 Tax=Dankookia sp. P2 TaxID=3423955 RepID=UPI003D67C9B3
MAPPFAAIDYCLDAAGTSFRNLDAVCANFDYGRYEIAFQEPVAKAYYQTCLAPRAMQAMLVERYGMCPPFVPVDHHLAHLHSALISAPFEECLGVVMDAAGEIGSTSVYHVAKGQVRRLARYPLQRSLGAFYSLVTRFLGYAFNEDEYKVMGLASLGNADRYTDFFASAILLRDGGQIEIPSLEENRSFVDRLFYAGTMQVLENGLGFAGADAPIGQKADVSAALQRRFTEAVFHICAHFAREAGTANLLLSGGCAENCMTAGALRDDGRFEQVYVGYASGDDGTALGAAAAHSAALGMPVRALNRMPFFGPKPQAAEVLAHAAARGLNVTSFSSTDAMLQAAAKDVAEDKIIALCNGRMEYGARALGNRSLLALPSNAANKDRINLAIKKRQSYRPFAPAVIAEASHVYFDLKPGEAYPYMTMLTRVRPDWVEPLAAIVHVDGTARVQTVDAEHNPAFHRFLTLLGQMSGTPVVLNTSYNVNHQPIVCNAEEAIDTFVEMGIDALYIADTCVTR